MKEYPLWQYPLIMLYMFFHFGAWKFWLLRRRIRNTLAWRREIGFFSEDYKPTLVDAMSFGHWLVGQWLITVWGKKRRSGGN